MNIKKLLNEIQAEIVSGSIPARKVFDLKGRVVPIEQLKKDKSLDLLKQVKAALIKAGVIDKFDPDDISTMDIKPGQKNTYILTGDDGSKYGYNVATRKVTSL